MSEWNLSTNFDQLMNFGTSVRILELGLNSGTILSNISTLYHTMTTFDHPEEKTFEKCS